MRGSAWAHGKKPAFLSISCLCRTLVTGRISHCAKSIPQPLWNYKEEKTIASTEYDNLIYILCTSCGLYSQQSECTILQVGNGRRGKKVTKNDNETMTNTITNPPVADCWWYFSWVVLLVMVKPFASFLCANYSVTTVITILCRTRRKN